MKLSEAIRAGAQLHPQGYEAYVSYIADEPHTCALGAAYEAITGRLPSSPNEPVYLRLYEAFPELAEWNHDITGESLRYVIVSKNDREERTREQIADWLEEQGL